MRSNALPLLHLLADGQQAQQQGGGSRGPMMRAAIASAVGALVESRGTRFPQVNTQLPAASHAGGPCYVLVQPQKDVCAWWKLLVANCGHCLAPYLLRLPPPSLPPQPGLAARSLRAPTSRTPFEPSGCMRAHCLPSLSAGCLKPP
jgi:hypothetical protein